ncbi:MULTISPECIES: helicase-related protein [Exiguobacterium]|uniref:helicase-related protein n=1 Tax=Exiguobacterium TaxID=33986 RepID=UPI001AE4F669|nr:MULTISPECIES: helicase-related protein [Exiguobacterium]MCT4779286.1 helicase-related protein [Exiguobacterium soli]
MDLRGRVIPSYQLDAPVDYPIKRLPAVTWRCQRCGQLPTRGPCTCGKRCYYCRHCLVFGKLRTCDYLVTDPRPLEPVQADHHAELNLTVDQQRIASAIVETIDQKKRLLVHAVCGAGKTPMLFPGIERALCTQKRVLITTPRADVVRELTVHVKRAFRQTTIVSLFGGSADRLQLGDITISTTHQLIHYRSCFDVVFIDEVDAFPYHADRTLHRYVHQAMRSGASLILLSATPSLRNKFLPTVRLMRRYHGFPLPVPRLQIPYTETDVLDWLATHSTKPRLVFVPKVDDLKVWQEVFRQHQLKSETVHAADPDRITKVGQFRQTTGILLTTTILERGVTLVDVQVAVLGADQAFSVAALIQISGRVGRSADFPEGEVVFFANDRSDAMYQAIHQIKQANREGFR